jgi:glycosyltransferase involved in cell wall biosynthesis
MNQATEQQMKLAIVWQKMGRFSQAIASVEKAIQLQPDYLPAHLALFELLVLNGQVDRAIDVYHQAMEQDAQQAWIFSTADREDLSAQARRHYQNAISQRSTAKETPHILLYTNCPGTYGAEQISHEIVVGLVQMGYQITYVQSKTDHHLIQARSDLGVEHIWLQGNTHDFAYTVSNAAEVAAIFARVQPDSIVFADGNPLDNLAANWLAMHLKIPYIRIIHCVIPDRAEHFSAYLCLLPDLYRSAQGIISVSQANLKLIEQKFELPEQLGQVIYNGRPDEYFAACCPEVRARLRQDLEIPQVAIVVFTAARMDTVKGYQHQVKAIEQLRDLPIWSQLYFVWAGVGHLETQLKAEIEQLGVIKQVKFLGERSDIPDLLDTADLFLLPSHVEGMPLAVMEAMAKGLPVMATAISGTPEALGNTGKLLPDPNVDDRATVRAIVDTIQAWAIDPELRRTMGKLCQQRAVMMFRQERMLDSYLTLIQQILDPAAIKT